VVHNIVVTNTLEADYDTYPGANTQQSSASHSDTATVTPQLNGVITKTIPSGITDKTIGDTIDYKITITIPEGTTPDFIVTDNLPAGLAYVPGSATITNNNNPHLSIQTTPTDPTEAPLSTVIIAGQSQSLTFDFDTIVNSNTNNGIDEEIYIDFEAVVLNDSDNAEGDAQTNAASVNLPTNPSVNAPPITITEPELAISKTGSYVSGDTIVYTLDITHTPGSTAKAFDIVLTDTFPAGTSFDGNIIVGPGSPTPTVDVTNFPIVTFTFTDLDLADLGSFTYEATIDPSVSSGTNLTNDVEATWTSQPASYVNPIPANDLSSERTGVITDPGGAINTYTDDDSVVSTVTRPDLSTSTKVVLDRNGGDVQGNDVLEYTVTIANTGDMPATGVRVTDEMPAHVHNLSVISLPLAPAMASVIYAGGANGTGSLNAFNINLDAAGGANAIQTVVYVVVVDSDIAANTTLENSMVVHAANEGGSGASDSAIVATHEPILGVTKSVDQTVVASGGTATFTVIVENAGDSNSLNTTITDTIPSGLTYVPGTIKLDGAAQTDADDTPVDNTDFGITTANTITVVLPVLSHDPTSVEITYDVTLISTSTNTVNVSDDHGEVLTASATITQASSGGGGVFVGSGDPGEPKDKSNPKDPDSRDENDVLRKVAPEEGPKFHEEGEWEPIEQCLRYDPDRKLKFSDVDGDPALDANVIKSTLLFDALQNKQYVMSGYATRLNDEGEKTAGLENSLTRLEWAKILMVSHCLPIYDYELIPKVTAFNSIIPSYADLPFEVKDPDPQTRWMMEVAYSASYYEIINGTGENLAAMMRPVSGAEAIKMFVRTGEFVHSGEFERSSDGLNPSLDPEAWYYEFFEKAAFEGTLKDYINSLDSAGNFVIRRNAVNLLLDALLRRDLYKLADEELILNLR